MPTTDSAAATAATDLVVIEDDTATLAVLAEALADVGLGPLRTAATLAEGLALLDERRPDLVLTDLHLPDSSGLDTLHQLGERAEGVPIVVLTGDAYAADLAVAAGADDAVVKGSGLPQVVSRVQRAVRRARRGQQVDLTRFFLQADGLLLVLDGDGAVLRANPAVTRRLGWSQTRLRDLPLSSRIHPDEVEEALAAIRRAAAGGTARVRARHSTDDGFWRDVDWSLGGDPATGLVYAVGTDVTDAVREVRALESTAHTDQLTGLANRMGLLTQLARRLEEGGGTAVLYCDLDGFKRVNDVHGHAHGDQVLAAAAGRIATRVRANDVAGRIGGDEFVVVTSPGRGAEQLAARLVEGFDRPVSIGGLAERIGISIGIAVARPDDDMAAVLQAADLAMYEAKTAGGDTWRVAGRDGDGPPAERVSGGS